MQLVYCDHALDEARRAGVSTCVFCDGNLIPVKLHTDSSSLKPVHIEKSPLSPITTEFVTTQEISVEDPEYNDLIESEKEETLEEEQSSMIEIVQHDYQIIRLIKDIESGRC